MRRGDTIGDDIRADRAGGDTIRVFTWNIHGGIGGDGRFDLARVVALVRRWNPDVIALQEVDSRKGKALTAFSFLADALGGHSVSAVSIAAPDGDYGQILISRWPVSQTETHDISAPEFEPRRAIEVWLDTPRGPLHIIATHLGLSWRARRRQASVLARLAGEDARTTVVMGDFNDWIWAGSVQRALKARLPAVTQHRTFPSRLPLIKLDRVFCRPKAALVASRIDRAAARISDHLPVIADIRTTRSS